MDEQNGMISVASYKSYGSPTALDGELFLHAQLLLSSEAQMPFIEQLRGIAYRFHSVSIIHVGN